MASSPVDAKENTLKGSKPTINPLLDAFCDDDVTESRQKLNQEAHKSIDADISIDRDRVAEIKEAITLIRAILDKDPQQALSDVQHLIKKDRASGEIYQLQGDCQLKLQDLDSAETSYWRAAYFGNRDSSVYLNLSSMLLMKGDVAGSRHILTKSKELGLSQEHYDRQVASIEKVINLV